MSELIVQRLKVHFNDSPQPVLHIPSLRVSSGSHIAVTGASGSGKTTLVNAVSGLDRCDEGQIFWDGEEIGSLSESGRDSLACAARWAGYARLSPLSRPERSG